MSYFAENVGTVEVILQFSLQIPKMEKWEKLMFNYAEIGGSPEEIHQNILQIPMMEKFEEQMFFAETGGRHP